MSGARVTTPWRKMASSSALWPGQPALAYAGASLVLQGMMVSGVALSDVRRTLHLRDVYDGAQLRSDRGSALCFATTSSPTRRVRIAAPDTRGCRALCDTGKHMGCQRRVEKKKETLIGP